MFPPIKSLPPIPEESNVRHTMRYDSHGSKGPGVYCTCGAKKIHTRGKPLVAWAKKHIARTGHVWKTAAE